MQAYIDFDRLIKGDYKRLRKYNPMLAYYVNLGATVRTNDLADENLIITKNLKFISILLLYVRREGKEIS
jgi:hypothetical protein